jgi:hypothetical protein
MTNIELRRSIAFCIRTRLASMSAYFRASERFPYHRLWLRRAAVADLGAEGLGRRRMHDRRLGSEDFCLAGTVLTYQLLPKLQIGAGFFIKPRASASATT